MTATKPIMLRVLQSQATLAMLCYAASPHAGDLIAKAIPKLDSSLSQTVSLNGGLIYDSNPLLSANDQEVWISRFSPRYLIQHNSDQDEQYLDLSMILQQSSDPSLSVNRQDPKVVVGINHLFSRGSFAANVSYAKRSTRLTQVSETGLVEDDGTIVNRSFNSSLNYLFSPYLTGSVGLSAASNRFDQAGQDLRNFDTFSLNSGISYAFSSLLTGKASLGVTHFKRANGTGMFTNAMVGANWSPTLNLDLSMMLGGNQVKLDNLPSNTSLSADLGANYITDTNRFNASFNRSVRPTGLSLQESDRLNLGLSHTYNQDISYGVSYQRLQTRNLITVETQVANVLFNKKLNREWNLNSYIKHRQVQRSIGNVDGLTIGLTLGYGYSDYQDDY